MKPSLPRTGNLEQTPAVRLPVAESAPIWLATLLIALGTVILLASARGDLWFDEILSFQWARSSKSPLDLLRLFRHDNNHPLNSLWIMCLGDGLPFLAYRGLSVISGMASLVLTWCIARRISPQAAWVPLMLSAFSFPLVLYASEARGYAPAIACALGAFLILLKTDGKPGWVALPAFWVLCIIGLLSHATMVTVIAALGVWSTAKALQKVPAARGILRIALWFFVPTTCAIFYYLYFLKPMMIAGGPEYTIPTVLSHFFAYASGAPLGGLLAALLGGAFIAAALVWGRFTGQRLRVFFLTVILLAPAGQLAIADHKFLYFRYFLVCLPFIHLLSGPLAQRLMEQSSPLWRVAGCAAIALFLVGQLPRIAALIQFGRGSYVQALEFIARSPIASKSIASDQDLRNGMVVEFYRRRLPDLSALQYFPQWQKSNEPATWLITNTQEEIPASLPKRLSAFGADYSLTSAFRTGPVSGTHWLLYRRVQEGPLGSFSKTQTTN